MKTETITWHQLPKDGMPDVEADVLVEFDHPQEPGLPTSIWLGWWSGEHWFDGTTGDRFERHGDTRVIAWAHMPAGSRTC